MDCTSPSKLSKLTAAKSASKALPEAARLSGFRYLLSTRTIPLSQSKISNLKSKMDCTSPSKLSKLTVAKSASKALPDVARLFGFRYLLSTRTIPLSQSKISNLKSKMDCTSPSKLSKLTVAKSASKALPDVARLFGFRYLLSTRTIPLSQSKISNLKSKMDCTSPSKLSKLTAAKSVSKPLPEAARLFGFRYLLSTRTIPLSQSKI